jgi:hypothetical protein
LERKEIIERKEKNEKVKTKIKKKEDQRGERKII